MAFPTIADIMLCILACMSHSQTFVCEGMLGAHICGDQAVQASMRRRMLHLAALLAALHQLRNNFLQQHSPEVKFGCRRPQCNHMHVDG